MQSPEFVEQVFRRKRPVIFAFWHGDELAILSLHRRYQVAGMVSTSRDGEMMAKALDLLGIKCSRGSSTRGGVSGLKGLFRLSQEGRIPTIAVDGPKGPYHRVKPGIFALSALMGAEIIPAGLACSRAIVFRKSWNKTYIPVPFARVLVVWGPPLPVVGREEDPHQARLAAELERSLNDAGRRAAELIAAPADRTGKAGPRRSGAASGQAAASAPGAEDQSSANDDEHPSHSDR
jgi:lysophospholipid acyltransferase (LPLAT)-like uncharacterized protein